MIVRLGAAPRAAGLSCDEFKAHWRGVHGGLAGQIGGLRGYVQNHAVLRDGWPLLPWVGFDACSEIEFDSLGAMDLAFASEYYRRQVVADEQVMVDKTHFYLLLAQRRILRDRQPPREAVKLLTFLPLAVGADRGALADALAGPYRDRLVDVPVVRHEQLLEIPGAHDGRPPAFCAAVDVLWFATVADALALVTGAAGHRARFELAGLAFGAERLIASPTRVV